MSNVEQAVIALVDAISAATLPELDQVREMCKAYKNDLSNHCAKRATYLRIERLHKEELK